LAFISALGSGRGGGRLIKALAAAFVLLLIGACASATAPVSPQRAAHVVALVPPPAQHPAHEGLVDVGGAQLFYWDTGGGGEPVILLHAATGSAESWLYQQPVLADRGYRVIGYSRREHYRSVPSSAPAPPPSVDLMRFMDALGLPRAHLVATAAGAIVAADFALSHPDRVKSLVLATSLISFQDPLVTQARRNLALDDLRRLPSHVLELSASYRFANPEGTALWAEIEHRALNAPAPARRSANSANAVTFDALSATRLPILLIGGDADLYLPPALLWEIGARLPNARTVLIRDAAHSVYWEQPQAFNAAVLSFLSDHTDAQRQ
jgi:pimeloyl-ACP methyl ester carboxylesterase